MSMLRRFPSSRAFSLSSSSSSSSCSPSLRYAPNAFRTRATQRLFTTSSSRFSSASTATTAATASTITARSSRRVLTIAAGLVVLSTSYALGVVFPPNLYTLIYPREAPPRAADNSPRALVEASQLEAELWSLPLVKELASKSYPLNADTVPPKFLGPAHIAGVNSTKNYDNLDPSLLYYMARPYVNLPESFSRHSLTAGLLQGPGRIAIPPLLFINVDEKAVMGVIHLGRSVCGHDGIVHGGLIATLFDDSLFRTAVASLPAKIAVTAWIKIDYKAPTRADQFVVFRNKVDRVEGRKAFVSGQMEDLEGNVLVKAEALFVQPKYAHLLKSEEREKHFLNRPAAIARTLEPVGETAGTK